MRKRTKADDKFRQEARAAFGQTAKAVDLSASAVVYDYDPQKARREEERLSAKHDPGRSSACRLCGVVTAPHPAAYRDVAGWKCCPDCSELLDGGLAAVLSELTGIAIAASEAEEVATRTRLGNPCRFTVGWPTEPGATSRWAHVDMTLAEGAESIVREIRARGTVRANSFGTGCAWCGVRTSTRWTESPFRYGKTRDAPRAALCAECEPWAARAGVHHGATAGASWRTFLLAACIGLTRARMEVTFGLKAFFESGSDPVGTASAWAYLGETRGKLRLRAAQLYPRSIQLDDREQRVLALQVAAAEPVRPDPNRLADVD